MKQSVILLAATALLLSGCTSPPLETQPTHQPANQEKVKPTRLAHPRSTAPADEWAGIISTNEKAWRDYDANIDSCNKAAEGVSPDDYIQYMGCIKNAQNAAHLARTARTAIVALGAPPPELAVLVAKTLKALVPLSKSDVATACQDAISDPCYQAVDQIDESTSTLVEVLEGWEPYKRPK